MEVFWYIIASIGAGVGTGLAGLSAATVMVPILIVLCPAFQGETGAYQATAIALASDVLGSAVTTGVYMKNKKIDLKHGWIMLVCILSMCTIGSFAAWLAGNVVLGGFTLFLTFCIGIRFLLMPDTEKSETISTDTKLGIKGIAISLFFGLTIGFGAGFVGTGGGMMMLVVFTAFLGMELKTAVGTSTFIMTFTALIASVSHIFIHPAIVLEQWDVLLLCIIVTTVSSLLSAQFANRVSNRTVGLVTGAVLTVLGACMIMLNYWELLSSITLIKDMFTCFAKYLSVLVPAVIVLLALYFLFHPYKELFRKLLHSVAFMSPVFFVYAAPTWQSATLCAAVFAILVYPLLSMLEGWKEYSSIFVQRKNGEIKKSLLLLFFMAAVLIALCWGLWHTPHLITIAFPMWGFGDAAAALIGKRLGKHHVNIPFADHKKTWEGTVSMATISFVVGILITIYVTSYSISNCILIVLPAAIISAFVELISHNGNDTVTVPVTNAVLLYIIMLII
ncbi:MAG: hypothetical protein E7290_13210 [Lachnospiraceae bacterium]|nr:hypothetical protein [Lachnospiraceae bacterium]